MRALGFCLLVVASLPCAAQSTHDFGAVDALIQQVVAGVPLPGASIVVVKDGATILESHYGNYGPNTRIPIASASKWVSATAIASLVDAVLLSWDSAVGSLIVDAPADKRAITLRELFWHTSGLPGSDGGCLGTQAVTLQACARQILDLPLANAPGSCFAYGGNSMQVAGRMAELASGQSWDTLFVQRVAQPLGLVATDYAFNSAQPGYVGVPCCGTWLIATAAMAPAFPRLILRTSGTTPTTMMPQPCRQRAIAASTIRSSRELSAAPRCQ